MAFNSEQYEKTVDTDNSYGDSRVPQVLPLMSDCKNDVQKQDVGINITQNRRNAQNVKRPLPSE